MMQKQLTTLSNGLRIITDPVDSVESVALGIWADVGTRNEDLTHNGVAHMTEHMLFNGTQTRNAQQIVKAVENVGGQMNAFTSREMTAYYVHLLKEDARLALDILSDMVLHSTFPDTEVEKERGIITQEIAMTTDTPDDHVFDLYQCIAYPDQALGAPILGTTEIIQNMPRQALVDYVDNFYTNDNLIISAAGNINHDDLCAWAEAQFQSSQRAMKDNLKPAAYQGGIVQETRELEQSHFVIGYQGIAKTDDQYYAAVLLAMVLGGGMSSRLFQSVREKHGLAYSIYAAHSAFKDDGQFEIYAGTSFDKVGRCTDLIAKELQSICAEGINETELSRAKAQMKSGILMSQESMMARANRQAKHLINFGKALDLQNIIQRIDAIQAADIQNMTVKIFATKATIAHLGAAEHDFASAIPLAA